MHRYVMALAAVMAIAACTSDLAFGEGLSGVKTSAGFSEPESVDIYRADAGAFLDVDMVEYAKKAYDAYNARQYETAAKYYLALLRGDIRDAISIYNLACCYALLGKDTLAVHYLARAFKAGFLDLEHAKADKDFDKVREKQVFSSLMDSLAQAAKRKRETFGTEIFIESPSYMRCYVRLPRDYDGAKAYPLLIGLHGYGGNPEDFVSLWEEFSDPQFIFACPQAPYAFSPGRRLGYSWNLAQAGTESVFKSEEYLRAVVQKLSQQYRVSSSYLMGVSQGCAVTYVTGIRNPDLFKGLVCLSGWLDEELLDEKTLEKGKKLRVFMAHARDDRIVEFAAAARARELLDKHGYDVTFHEFQGGHTVTGPVLEEAQKWMMK